MKVRKAIQRYETGEYGICIQCKEPISQERLQAVPEQSYASTVQKVGKTNCQLTPRTPDIFELAVPCISHSGPACNFFADPEFFENYLRIALV
ncbi:MAG: TraR/DksA family transcriptional regulator [Porticoccaceae bacterium]